MIELKHIEFAYEYGSELLRDINMQVNDGEYIAVVGENGSGKTTLLRCLNFLERPDGGVISLRGEPLLDASRPPDRERDLRRKRLHFGLVFQDFNLFPQYTALENVTLARRLARRDGETEQDIRDRGLDLLDQMGLSDRAGHYPHQLSGGMLQRIMIGIATAMEPVLLIADEPTTAIDAITQYEILNEFLRVKQEKQTAMVFISHDLNAISRVADRIVVLNQGRVVFDGPADTPAPEILSAVYQSQEQSV